MGIVAKDHIYAQRAGDEVQIVMKVYSVVWFGNTKVTYRRIDYMAIRMNGQYIFTKTAEPIDMPFGEQTRVAPRNHLVESRC